MERERESNGNKEKSNKSNLIFKTSLGPNKRLNSDDLDVTFSLIQEN